MYQRRLLLLISLHPHPIPTPIPLVQPRPQRLVLRSEPDHLFLQKAILVDQLSMLRDAHMDRPIIARALLLLLLLLILLLRRLPTRRVKRVNRPRRGIPSSEVRIRPDPRSSIPHDLSSQPRNLILQLSYPASPHKNHTAIRPIISALRSSLPPTCTKHPKELTALTCAFLFSLCLFWALAFLVLLSLSSSSTPPDPDPPIPPKPPSCV